MTKRKTLLLLICSLLLALSAAFPAIFGKVAAHAFPKEPDAVGTLDNGEGGFDKTALSHLYGLLKTGATQLSDLDELAQRQGGNATGTGAYEFSTADIVLSFGQKKWTPVHLTKDQEGHTIPTP